MLVCRGSKPTGFCQTTPFDGCALAAGLCLAAKNPTRKWYQIEAAEREESRGVLRNPFTSRVRSRFAGRVGSIRRHNYFSDRL